MERSEGKNSKGEKGVEIRLYRRTPPTSSLYVKKREGEFDVWRSRYCYTFKSGDGIRFAPLRLLLYIKSGVAILCVNSPHSGEAVNPEVEETGNGIIQLRVDMSDMLSFGRYPPNHSDTEY